MKEPATSVKCTILKKISGPIYHSFKEENSLIRAVPLMRDTYMSLVLINMAFFETLSKF